MWFKQLQLFQLPTEITYSLDNFVANLEQCLFKPCLPSIPVSAGWTTLSQDENAPLVRQINHCLMFCLQIEERILPASVIRQSLMEKIKQIEVEEGRKVYQKEKLSLKDEITITLLPRAFTKLSRVYAYIDTQHHWLVLGTTSAAKTKQFLSLFKKTVNEQINLFDLNKLAPIMTHWLKNNSYPTAFTIEKNCALEHANQSNKKVRVQQQDLFTQAIQTFIQEGYQAKQLALSWQGLLNFMLNDDFSLRSLNFADEVKEQAKEMEPESKQQQIDADFLIMSQTLRDCLQSLLNVFEKKTQEASPVKKEELHSVIE